MNQQFPSEEDLSFYLPTDISTSSEISATSLEYVEYVERYLVEIEFPFRAIPSQRNIPPSGERPYVAAENVEQRKVESVSTIRASTFFRRNFNQ